MPKVMTIDVLRDTVARLNNAASELAALGAALDARASGTPIEPALGPHIDAVVEALGVREALAEAEPMTLRPLIGEIQAFALTNTKLLFAASRHAGWEHTERALLQAAGEVSVAVPRALKRSIARQLPGLAEGLDAPDAAFLDIGVGVGALSIEMARLWPALRIVGIDRWAPALALARERVQSAGLVDRIELREQSAEALDDSDAYTLAWLPGVFVSEEAVRGLIAHLHRALRPGGWLLIALFCSAHDPLTSALARLRTAMFGGFVTTEATVEALLKRQGFVDVRTLPRSPGSLGVMVAAQR